MGTLPPKVTTQMPTTKPKPVCVYGEETHSIPFTGCKCPDGFEIDTTHKQMNGEDCCACNPLPTTPPVITTTPPTHASVCIEGGSKHTIPYEKCRCPEGFKVDQSYVQVDGESCCMCDHIPTTQPSTLTTKIPSKPPLVCIEGGEAHKIPFKDCFRPDDFLLDESHPQVAGKLCCKCVHVPTTQPGTVTTEQPTQPPHVCIDGGVKHLIPFRGCKCPEGFEIDTTHKQENGKPCCSCNQLPTTLPPKVTTQVPTTKPKPVCIYGEETHSIPFTGCKCPEGFEIDTTHKQENGEDCCACNPLPTTAPVITTTSPTHAPICIESGSKHTIPYMNRRCPEGFKVDQS